MKHSCLQIVDLLTWKAEASAPMTSLWDTKDSLQRSELAELVNNVDHSQEIHIDGASDATSARVLAVSFCHALAQTAGVSDTLQRQHAHAQTAQALLAATAGVLLLEKLVAIMKKDLALQTAVPFKGSDVHRKKIRVWQALSVLSAFSQENNSSTLQVGDVIGHLKQHELASVKQYQETGAFLSTLVPVAAVRFPINRLMLQL